VVRRAILGSEEPIYSGYTAWRGVTTFDHAALAVGESWGPGQRFGQVPMAHGEVYWFATQNAPAGARAHGGEKAEVLRLFGHWHHPIASLVEHTAAGGGGTDRLCADITDGSSRTITSSSLLSYSMLYYYSQVFLFTSIIHLFFFFPLFS
jgi:hypothetical protein